MLTWLVDWDKMSHLATAAIIEHLGVALSLEAVLVVSEVAAVVVARVIVLVAAWAVALIIARVIVLVAVRVVALKIARVAVLISTLGHAGELIISLALSRTLELRLSLRKHCRRTTTLVDRTCHRRVILRLLSSRESIGSNAAHSVLLW